MQFLEAIDREAIAQWLMTSGIRIFGIVVGAYILTKIIDGVTRRGEHMFDDDDPTTMNEREKRAATLGRVIRNAGRIVVWSGALLMIAKELGIDIGPLLAGVGIVGIAIGFGAQSLVKDLVAGFFILSENQFGVGDVIEAAGHAGLVERITLRATTLRDLEGKVHIIPNGTIEVVTNMTKEWSRAMLDVGVAYKEDVDHVMEVLKEIGEGLEKDDEFGHLILEPLAILGVNSFGDSSVDIRVMFTTQPLQQWTVGREFRRRIKNTFDAKGIEIPFPHRTVYLGEGSPMNGRLSVRLAGDNGDVPQVPPAEDSKNMQPKATEPSGGLTPED